MPDQGQPGRPEIAALVISSLNEVLSQKGISPPEPLGESTYLIGAESVLDSLGLITLMVSLEEHVEEQYGVPLVLADGHDMARKDSPFQTVRSLTEHICSLMMEKPHDA